jgi:hypothetical protein
MALRIRRGLSRLWIALSVLWIGGVGVVTWRSLPTKYELTKAFVPVQPSGEPTFDPHEFALFKRTEVIKSGAEIALIPPALVLVIGLASVWVVRGFR